MHSIPLALSPLYGYLRASARPTGGDSLGVVVDDGKADGHAYLTNCM